MEIKKYRNLNEEIITLPNVSIFKKTIKLYKKNYFRMDKNNKMKTC